MMETNTLYEEKLKTYMRENNVSGEHLTFTESTRSVAEAAKAAGVTPQDFVKNICLIDSNGSLVVGIVKGEDRVSTSRVAKLLGVETVRTATPDEILSKTGYPCGGTPSYGYRARFLIDERVFQKDIVYTGGGSVNSLVKIPPAELLRANGGEVVRLRK
jgi:prolyl-tRNA editing enzyme YbaK/EbsC (Cys-tRNA(Pro) deacylase)